MKTIRLLMLAFLGLAGYVGAGKAANANHQGDTLYRRTGTNAYEEVVPGSYLCNNPSADVTCTYRKIDPEADISDDNSERFQSGTYFQVSQ